MVTNARPPASYLLSTQLQHNLQDTEYTLDQVVEQLQQAREREELLDQQLTERLEEVGIL